MRQAAVLVPLFRDRAGELRLVVVRRAAGGIHGGQLGFPGGKEDPEDASLRDTALREAREEIGLDGGVEILDDLPVARTLTSGFAVAPFLARIDLPAAWRLDEREIAQILEVRLADFARPAARGREVKSFPTWPEPRWVPFYRVGEHKLWGLSYRIRKPLVPRLLAGEWEV